MKSIKLFALGLRVACIAGAAFVVGCATSGPMKGLQLLVTPPFVEEGYTESTGAVVTYDPGVIGYFTHLDDVITTDTLKLHVVPGERCVRTITFLSYAKFNHGPFCFALEAGDEFHMRTWSTATGFVREPDDWQTAVMNTENVLISGEKCPPNFKKCKRPSDVEPEGK